MSTTKARELRKNPTDAERKLWRYLRQVCGYKFRRQQPLGPYIVDFICLEKKVIVEVDGGQHNEQVAYAYDGERSAWLEAQGFRVLRFWNHEVLKEIEVIKEVIAEALNTTSSLKGKV
ncbi:MAG: endonuclease domain-containing protein [Thermodesulfobacteriota bacterium]